MALAKITITCKECGRTFEHRHTCINRTDADNYEIWAAEHIDTCPECYAKRKAAEEAAKNITVTLFYGDYKKTELKSVRDSYDAATKTIQVIIPKELVELISDYKSDDIVAAYCARNHAEVTAEITPDVIDALKKHYEQQLEHEIGVGWKAVVKAVRE